MGWGGAGEGLEAGEVTWTDRFCRCSGDGFYFLPPGVSTGWRMQ